MNNKEKSELTKELETLAHSLRIKQNTDLYARPGSPPKQQGNGGGYSGFNDGGYGEYILYNIDTIILAMIQKRIEDTNKKSHQRNH